MALDIVSQLALGRLARALGKRRKSGQEKETDSGGKIQDPSWFHGASNVTI
jgi:hypothetical protein